MALYWPATRCDFVNADDDLHVTENAQVQKGLTLESFKWAWVNPVNTNWHPLTVLSHMLDCQLFGLKPWGHHLSSVLLHAVNTGLVFLLLRGLTGAVWRSVWVAALFAVHPLRVEPVVAVALGRKEVLCDCFGLLALMAYARYVEGRKENVEFRMQNAESGRALHASRFTLPDSAFYLLSLCFFACGLMSKGTLVTLPFVMLLLDYWPMGRMQKAGGRMQNPDASDTHHPSSVAALRRVDAPRTTPHASRLTAQSQIANCKSQKLFFLLVEKIPFFALAALMSVVTFVVQQREGALVENESLPLGARVGTALISYCRYLGKLFWPADLVAFYPHPGYWPLGKVLLAGGLLLGLSVLVWVGWRRHPYFLMGWLWYCGTLVPVSQVVQTGSHAMADRYTYVPSLGVLILVVWGVGELTRGWRYRVLALSVAGGAALVLCLALTRCQIGYWGDSETLWRHALEVTENNAGAHWGLGWALARKGQTDEAISELQESARLKPEETATHVFLGLVLLNMKGRTDEAIRQFQEVLRCRPYLWDMRVPGSFYADIHYWLGSAFDKKGQTDEAIRQFQEVLRLKPDYAAARRDLDAALATKTRPSPPPGAATNP